MTGADDAAIVGRLLAGKNGDTISTVANTRFTDIPAHAWYSGYAKYLNNNGVTYGKSKTIFAPDDAIPAPSSPRWPSASLMCTAMATLRSWSSIRTSTM